MSAALSSAVDRKVARRPKRVAIAVIAMMLGACASSNAPQQIIGLAVPTGDRVPSIGTPDAEGHALRFTADFDSHLSQVDYLRWVADRLTRDGFTVRGRDQNSVLLNRTDVGDEYQLRLDTTANTPTHVRVTLRATPD